MSVYVFIVLALVLRTTMGVGAMNGPFSVDTFGTRANCTAPAAWSGTVSVSHDVWYAFRRQQGALRMNHSTVMPHTSTAVPRTPTPTTFSPTTSRPAPTTPPMVNVTGTWVAVVCNGMNELNVYHVAKGVATPWPTDEGVNLPNGNAFSAPVFTASGDFYVHGDTNIYRYHLATGKEHWVHQSGSSIVTMVANDDVVAVLRRDGVLSVVNSETGNTKCSYSTATAVVATPNFVAFQLTGGSALQFVDRNCSTPTASQVFGQTDGTISAFGHSVCGGYQGTWTCASTENWQLNQWQIRPSIEPIAGSSDAKDCAYVDHEGHAKLADGLSSSRSAIVAPVAPSFGSPAGGTIFFTVVVFPASSSPQYSLMSLDTRNGIESQSLESPSKSPVGIVAVYGVGDKKTYAFVMQTNGDLTYFTVSS